MALLRPKSQDKKESAILIDSYHFMKHAALDLINKVWTNEPIFAQIFHFDP